MGNFYKFLYKNTLTTQNYQQTSIEHKIKGGKMRKILSFIFLVVFISISNIVYAAESLVGQVNGMMCIKCQKMVTEALQKACPDATVKVSWPEGVAVSSFADKSNLNEEEYKQAIAGTGFEVVKVIKVAKIIDNAEEARKLVD